MEGIGLLNQSGLNFDLNDMFACIVNRGITAADITILAFIGLAVLYYYANQQLSYFSKRGIKHIPYSIPWVGNMWKVLRQKEHMMDYMDRLYKAYPDQKYVGHMQMNRPLIMVRDLDILKQIRIESFENFINHEVTFDDSIDTIFGNHLFTLKGDKWKEMRATLTPVFTRSKMRKMCEFITEIGTRTSQYYLNCMKEPENRSRGLLEIEMRDVFARYASDVIATSSFGLNVNSLTEPDNEFFVMSRRTNNFAGSQLVKFFLFSAFPKFMTMLKIPLLSESIKNYYRHLVLGTMARRKEEGVIRQDLIQLLIEARSNTLKHEDDSGDEDVGPTDENKSKMEKIMFKRNWTDNEIVAQAYLFLFAGFDTSATVLSFMSHELVINPEIQEKLHKEIDEIYNETGGKFTYNDLSKLKYMDMVVSEVLRMWPPAIFADRQCLRPYELPPVDKTQSRGYVVQPGEGIWIPIFAIHRDAQLFPEPTKFNPERFSDENKHKIIPNSYIPFGLGPRSCFGSRFAMMTVKVAMFHMLAHFDFVKIPWTQVPIQVSLKASITLGAKDGFWIGLKPRRKFIHE